MECCFKGCVEVVLSVVLRLICEVLLFEGYLCRVLL